MKNKLSITLLFVIFMLGTACSDKEDIIYDFINPSVVFVVRDAQTGADLLDPATENNILDQPIAVLYNGVRYTVEPDLETRLNLPRGPLALRLGQGKRHYNSLATYVLSFGEFEPGGLYDQEFVIEWGDGTSDSVVFSLYVEWTKGEPDVYSPISFRGQRNEGSGGYKHWLLYVEK